MCIDNSTLSLANVKKHAQPELASSETCIVRSLTFMPLNHPFSSQHKAFVVFLIRDFGISSISAFFGLCFVSSACESRFQVPFTHGSPVAHDVQAD